MILGVDARRTARLNGDPWVAVGEYPRPIAESLRRTLERYRVPSVVRTPWQWVMGTPVIEIETGGYQGLVELYVPEVMLEDALRALGLDEDPDLEPDADPDAGPPPPMG